MERIRQSISIGTNNRFHPTRSLCTLLVETIESSAYLALRSWLAPKGKRVRRTLATNLLDHEPLLAFDLERSAFPNSIFLPSFTISFQYGRTFVTVLGPPVVPHARNVF